MPGQPAAMIRAAIGHHFVEYFKCSGNMAGLVGVLSLLVYPWKEPTEDRYKTGSWPRMKWCSQTAASSMECSSGVELLIEPQRQSRRPVGPMSGVGVEGPIMGRVVWTGRC